MTDLKAWIEERRAIQDSGVPFSARDSRANFPRALNALNAALELHVKGYETAGVHWCSECEMTWPCATVQAVQDAIEGGR